MKNWKRVIEESGKVEAGRGRGSKKNKERGGAKKIFDEAERGVKKPPRFGLWYRC